MAELFDANDTVIDYLTKESQEGLKQFESNTDFVKLIQTILKSIQEANSKETDNNGNSTNENFNNVITDLRRLHKYESKLFTIILDCIKESMPLLFNNSFDSNIVINASLLLYEIVFNSQCLIDCNWIINLFPTLLEYSIYGMSHSNERENHLIQFISDNILIQVMNNHFSLNIFEALLLFVDDTDINLVNKSLNYIYGLINHLMSLKQIHLIDWDLLIRQCIYVFHHYDENYKQTIYSFVAKIRQLLSKNEWNKILLTIEYKEALWLNHLIKVDSLDSKS